MTTLTVNFGHKDYGFKKVQFERGIETSPIFEKANQVLVLSTEKKLEQFVDNFFRKVAVPVSIGLGYTGMTLRAFASTGVNLAEKLTPLISIVQDLALPVGIVVASWGLIEIIMGNLESGKHKLKYSVIGFVGMFIIPQVFYSIKEAFGQPNLPTITPEQLKEAQEVIQKAQLGK